MIIQTVLKETDLGVNGKKGLKIEANFGRENNLITLNFCFSRQQRQIKKVIETKNYVTSIKSKLRKTTMIASCAKKTSIS